MKKEVNGLGDRMDDFQFAVVSRDDEKPKQPPKKPPSKRQSLQN